MKVGGADSMECFTYLRNVTDLLSDGRCSMKDVLGNHLKDRFFQLVHWLSVILLLRRPVKNPSISKESLTWIVPRIRFVRGVNLDGWRTGRRPRGVGDDGCIGNLLKNRLIAKEVIFPKEGEFIFPIADGRIKTVGGDQDLRTSTLVRPRPIQGESNIDFLGESEGSLPPPQDSFPDAGEARNDFWSCQETSYTAITLKLESNFTCREKNHSLFHWNTLTFPELHIRIWMSSRRNALMIIGTLMALETCLTLGQVSHNLLYSMKNVLMDICGPVWD